MIVLGLHFGHDAAVAVVRDGEILAYLLRERHRGVKHAIGLEAALVERALGEAGLTVGDVDVCALSSTQGVELLTGDPDAFRIEIAPHPGHDLRCALAEQLAAQGRTVEERFQATLLASLYGEESAGSWLREAWVAFFPEHRGRRREDFRPCPTIDSFWTEPAWDAGATLEELAAGRVEAREELRYGFHYPAVAVLGGRRLPAYLLHHHLAHAGASYYPSAFGGAAVLTHDGFSEGDGYHSGMFYLGRGNALYPLAPHHLTIGGLYDRVGIALGLGVTGPAGKLMGLSAYGEPRFHDEKFVGNFYDHRRRLRSDLASAWMYHCVSSARRAGYDMAPQGDPARATAPINADIAASTQHLFERVRQRAVDALAELLERSGLATPNLCLSGGTALNCPSNSAVAASGRFERVWVEPWCDDGGLAIGAALALYHSLYDRPLRAAARPFPSPFLGAVRTDGEIRRALEAAACRVRFEPCAAPGEAAAEDLAADRVVGWFQDGSEAGPRALGHRSILADPRRAENWPRVNRIKGRERWRPFAPAVLAERCGEWFDGLPLPSPYMLFNARVRRPEIPAVTHVDGSSRVQTVDASCGEYYHAVRRFAELTGVPVILNTSFNGPGEPIVETPEQAIAMLLAGGLDVLYAGSYRVLRRED